MGTTLDNGTYLPDEGERNCYDGLAGNWVALDNHLGSTDIHVTINDKQAWNGHIADTTIHVTAEDKAAWNGKADASALTAHTGDTTIHVTAEDKAKWDTVTGKANDADVVHKSGNETKSGELTLSDTLNSSGIVPRSNNTYDFGSVSNLLRNLYTYHGYFRGQQQGDEYSNNARTNLTLLANRDSVGQSGCVVDTFRENTSQGTGMHILGFGMKENSVRYGGLRIQWIYDDVNLGYNLNLKPNNQGINKPLTCNLGTSTDKWNSINGLNPSSLSLPSDRRARIDISSYFTNTGTGDTNSYTVPANGYINLQLTDVVAVHCFSNTSNNLANYCQTFSRASDGMVYVLFPVRKNDVFACQWYTSTTVNVAGAFFIPCQGNI